MDSDNWIVEALSKALDTWNTKLSEIWQIVEVAPQDFKGGTIWTIIESINSVMVGIGLGLLVLFTAIGIFGSTLTFRDFKRPELALKHFLRFVMAKTAVTYSMSIMTTIFDICANVVSSMASHMSGVHEALVLPESIIESIENTGFLQSIPLWLVAIIGSLFITALAFIMIMSVYSRFFRLYMYTALSPLPLSQFAGEATHAHGKQFVKNYIGVCMEGAIIILACLIFSAFVTEQPTVTGNTPFTQSFGYIAEVVFNLLVLVGLIKGSDRIAKEIIGI